jgi:kynurenine formamidase
MEDQAVRVAAVDPVVVKATGADDTTVPRSLTDARERDVLGVGVETVGTDARQAGTFDPFPNHSTMHGAGKFGITSLINLDQLPSTGAVVIAAPLKIAGGSGSPLRVIALVPA